MRMLTGVCRSASTVEAIVHTVTLVDSFSCVHMLVNDSDECVPAALQALLMDDLHDVSMTVR